MRTRFIILMVLVFALTTQLAMAKNEAFPVKEGSLNSALIQEIQDSFSVNSTEKRLVDAVINNPIQDIAINQSVLQNHNTLFSHKIETGQVCNQKHTGRCWMYAALNVLRPAAVQKLKMKEFEFSQNYLYFWDKMEKANSYLEKVIERIDVDIRDPKMRRILGNPIEDGGYWQTATNLIRKYGCVPQSVMPETESTGNSRQMNKNIIEKLRLAAYDMREKNEQGASLKKLRREKVNHLQDVYRMLVFHLGQPPVDFEYRYETRSPRADEVVNLLGKIIQETGEADFTQTEAFKGMDTGQVSVVKKYTPMTFAEAFVFDELDDFVMVANWPAREIGKLYNVELTTNVLEGEPLNFLNVSLKDMKMACLQSVLGNDPVDFSADVSHGLDRKAGIMNSELYQYGDVYGIDIRGPKRAETVLGNVGSQHAMVFMGVDIVDEKIVKWRVENSWGADAGDKGYFYMYDNWFDDYVLRAVVKKKYLPQRLMTLFDQKPIIIPENEPEQ
ncbi:hypothetical protein KAH55_05535 [bacterium]|nr:hypothetical protein [bacterium]